MPLYAFRCESCKHERDYLMGTKNYRVPKCEKCGEKMARVYSVGGVIFKGDFPGKDIKIKRENDFKRAIIRKQKEEDMGK